MNTCNELQHFTRCRCLSCCREKLLYSGCYNYMDSRLVSDSCLGCFFVVNDIFFIISIYFLHEFLSIYIFWQTFYFTLQIMVDLICVNASPNCLPLSSNLLAKPYDDVCILYFSSFYRNLKIGYFSQHHVDQLGSQQTPLELIASKFPGRFTEKFV